MHRAVRYVRGRLNGIFNAMEFRVFQRQIRIDLLVRLITLVLHVVLAQDCAISYVNLCTHEIHFEVLGKLDFILIADLCFLTA